MTRFTDTMPPEHFEALYRAEGDPWKFASSEYEAAKYAATLAALPRSRFQEALEIGCSIGVFTRQLAERCDRLIALDGSATALAAAQDRCRDRPNIDFRLGIVPSGFPEARRFDLIVLSEVVYYLTGGDVRMLAERCGAAAVPNAALLLVHWTGLTNYPLSGDEAAEAFIDAIRPLARPVRQDRQDNYRLDLLRVDGPNA